MEVAVEADGSVQTSSPAAEGLEHRGSEVIMDADGMTLNDSEGVCNGHSDNGNSEKLKSLKEEKEHLERICASLELENERLGSECTQLLATNSQLVLDNSNLQVQKVGANLIQDDNRITLFYTRLPMSRVKHHFISYMLALNRNLILQEITLNFVSWYLVGLRLSLTATATPITDILH